MADDTPQPAEYRRSGGIGELVSEIEIRADPGRVWAVLTAFPEYPSWNPFIRQIAGSLAVGGTITAILKPPGTFGMTIHPVLLSVDPGRELRWAGRLTLSGMFEAEHSFEIRHLSDQSSILVQRERFSGLLLPFFELTLKDATARGFAAMNAALKERAEQGPAAAKPSAGTPVRS